MRRPTLGAVTSAAEEAQLEREGPASTTLSHLLSTTVGMDAPPAVLDLPVEVSTLADLVDPAALSHPASTPSDPASAEVAEPVVRASHLSPSSATTFAQCPRRWRFRYVERLPDPPGLAALAGTLVHRVLELLLAEEPAQRTLDRARGIAGQEWAVHAADPDLARLGLSPDEQRAYKWRVWKAVAGLWDLEDPAGVEVAATEQRLEVALDGVPFLGVIDRVDRTADGLVVTDYKSGRPPAPRRVQEKLDQVLLYAAAVAAAGDEAPVRARLLYLGAQAIEVEATPDSVEAAVSRLRARWDDLTVCVGADDFPPRTGPLCAWCPYVGRCAEGRAEVVTRLDEGRVSPEAPGPRLLGLSTEST